MPHYEHLTEYERGQIAQMRRSAIGYAEIGRELSRSASTIWRECQRNTASTGPYVAGRAHKAALARRRIARRPRLVKGPAARWIMRRLKATWSPDQISGRGQLTDTLKVSFMTIYRALERPENREYRKYLRGPDRRRKRNKKTFPRIHDRRMIDERPAKVDERKEPGHWEGDTVRGPMRTPECVMTLVERTTQYLVARKLEDRSAAALNQAAAQSMKKMPMETLTVDNGMEFASHKELARLTQADVYFAHEKCPWERGTNEQVNGLLRQFFPKGTDFGRVTPAELKRAVNLINDRPRKSLGYRTPAEALADHGFALVT